jgi:hypothetical protein
MTLRGSIRIELMLGALSLAIVGIWMASLLPAIQRERCLNFEQPH